MSFEIRDTKSDLKVGEEAAKGFERDRVNLIYAVTTSATTVVKNATARVPIVFAVDMATSKKLPAMFSEQSPVVMGGLASYGQNFHETGRLSAGYVQKIMTGAQPSDLRVETVDKFELVINLKTAKQIGVTIPPDVLARVDRVIR